MTQRHAPLMCIVGPTAAGKSGLAMTLAARCGLAILSADSRQIYRRFDIGTAKPTLAEREEVVHYGVDIIEPTERYSAQRWADDAVRWCDDARHRGLEPLIVGGTGLYVRALVEPFDDVPGLDPARRAQLGSWLDALDRGTLTRWCARLDPARAHLGRTQLLRAVETALLTGRRLSDHFRARHVADGDAIIPHRPVRYLVVDPGPVLAERIAGRVHDMVRRGFFEEVARLCESVPADAPAWNACGYRAVREALDGTRSRASATERTIIESRQYAKRQRTWFRHQLSADVVTHVNPDDPDADAIVQRWWHEAQSVPQHSGATVRANDGSTP